MLFFPAIAVTVSSFVFPCSAKNELDLVELLRADAHFLIEMPDIAALRNELARTPFFEQWLAGVGHDVEVDGRVPGIMDLIALALAPKVSPALLEAVDYESALMLDIARALNGQLAMSLRVDDEDLFFQEETDETGPMLFVMLGELDEADDLLEVVTNENFVVRELREHGDLEWRLLDSMGMDVEIALTAADGLIFLVVGDSVTFSDELEALSNAFTKKERRRERNSGGAPPATPGAAFSFQLGPFPPEDLATMAPAFVEQIGERVDSWVTVSLLVGADGIGIDSTSLTPWMVDLWPDGVAHSPAPIRYFGGEEAPWTGGLALNINLEAMIQGGLGLASFMPQLTEMGTDFHELESFMFSFMDQMFGVDVRADLLELMTGDLAFMGFDDFDEDLPGTAGVLHALGLGTVRIGTTDPEFLMDSLQSVFLHNQMKVRKATSNERSWLEFDAGLDVPLCMAHDADGVVISVGEYGVYAAMRSWGEGRAPFLAGLSNEQLTSHAIYVVGAESVLSTMEDDLGGLPEFEAFRALMPRGAQFTLTASYSLPFMHQNISLLAPRDR